MKIKFFIMFLTVILPFRLISQETIYTNKIILSEVDEVVSESLFKIGSDNLSDNSKFFSLFNNQEFEEIFNFLNNLPTRQNNFAVQEIVRKILKSQFDVENLKLTSDEDKRLFELRINKLFDTASFIEIDKIYSSTPSDLINENINLKRIEAYFLRNEYKNACNLLKNESFSKSYILGKFEIICNIMNQEFEKARFSLALLKEINQPGDNLFIDLCYNIMGDVELSKSKIMSENLEKISSLNPILLSSLQIAEISPKFEHIKNAPTSFLTFVLGSPSSSTEIKLYTAESLVKQKRIDNSMLAEIYQLIIFEDDEINEPLKNYKTLSPVRARSLLYQALVNEKNQETKFQIVKALLRHAKNDRLFSNISFLVKDSIQFNELDSLSVEDRKLILEIYTSIENYDEAVTLLKKFGYENEVLNENFRELAISLHLKQYIKNKTYFDLLMIEDLLDQVLEEKQYNKNKENLILISSLVFDFNETINNKILKLKANASNSNLNIFDLVIGLNAIENKDYFNSLNIIFKIFNEKKINELSELEIFLTLKTLLNLELFNEFKFLVDEILTYNL